jgi:hypothetical protein
LRGLKVRFSEFFYTAAALGLLLVACGDDSTAAAPDESSDDDPSSVGAKKDASASSTHADASTRADAGKRDAAAATDPNEPSSDPDAGEPTQPTKDAGSRFVNDAGSGVGTGSDAGKADAGHADASVNPCDSITYDSFGKAFIASYCVSCHGPTIAQGNVKLDSLAGVTASKGKVKTEVSSSAMPPFLSPAPTAAERKELGQWIDCGPK